jgi:protein SCO1/2
VKSLTILLSLCALLNYSVGCSKKQPVSLPPKGKAIADFTLLNQAGQEVSLSTFKGQVWIANFVFTTCPSICPQVTRSVAGLQKELDRHKNDTKLVTFTVDPETDTPDVLKKYGEKYGADFSRWSFLTAPSVEDMRTVVEGNFKTAMGDKRINSAGMYDIAHTTKLVLVDQEGNHRGYFASDSQGIGHLLEASNALSSR